MQSSKIFQLWTNIMQCLIQLLSSAVSQSSIDMTVPLISLELSLFSMRYEYVYHCLMLSFRLQFSRRILQSTSILVSYFLLVFDWWIVVVVLCLCVSCLKVILVLRLALTLTVCNELFHDVECQLCVVFWLCIIHVIVLIWANA